jgi:hypothetical protein
MEKISLCQLSFLIDWLKKNEHFDIYDLDFDKPENKWGDSSKVYIS